MLAAIGAPVLFGILSNLVRQSLAICITIAVFLRAAPFPLSTSLFPHGYAGGGATGASDRGRAGGVAGGRRQPGACGGDGVGGFERAAAHALASARWAAPLTGGNLVVAGLLLANQFSFVGALLFYRSAKRGGEPSPSREGAKKGILTGFRFIAYGCNRRRHPLGSRSNKKNLNEVSRI